MCYAIRSVLQDRTCRWNFCSEFFSDSPRMHWLRTIFSRLYCGFGCLIYEQWSWETWDLIFRPRSATYDEWLSSRNSGSGESSLKGYRGMLLLKMLTFENAHFHLAFLPINDCNYEYASSGDNLADGLSSLCGPFVLDVQRDWKWQIKHKLCIFFLGKIAY